MCNFRISAVSSFLPGTKHFFLRFSSFWVLGTVQVRYATQEGVTRSYRTFLHGVLLFAYLVVTLRVLYCSFEVGTVARGSNILYI